MSGIIPQGQTHYRLFTGNARLDARCTPGGLIGVNSASPVTITIPESTEIDWPAGTIMHVVELGDGAVTIAVEGSDTIDGTVTSISKGAILVLVKSDQTHWECALIS